MAANTLLRTAIIRGGAMVTLGGQDIYSAGPVSLSFGFDLQDLDTPIGRADRRVTLPWIKIRFTPASIWDAGILAQLYPHAAKVPGSTIYPDTDINCVVEPLAASQANYTCKGAIVTKMPDLIFSSNKRLFGECEVTCYGVTDSARGTAGNLYTTTTGAGKTGYVPANEIMQPYTATWARVHEALTAVDVVSKDGFTVSFDLQTQMVMRHDYGIGDIIVQKNNARVSCNPLCFTQAGVNVGLESVLQHEHDSEKNVGESINDHGYTFTINEVATGTAIQCQLVNARILELPYQFAFASERVGTLTLETVEAPATGAIPATYTIAAT